MEVSDTDGAWSKTGGISHVFRDFERSALLDMRDAVVAYPKISLAAFAVTTLFWTVLMTLGVTLHWQHVMSVSLTPHIAQYALILAFFLYPPRLYALPVILYVLLFGVLFFLPFGPRWHDIPGINHNIFMWFFVLNFSGAVGAGLVMRFILDRLSWMRRDTLDLTLALIALPVFTGFGILQMHMTFAVFADLPPDLAAAIGITPGHAEPILERTLRGGVVFSGFLIAVMQRPTLQDTLRAMLWSILFPALHLAQEAGLTVLPMMEITGLAMMLGLLLPVEIGLLACVIGIPVYSALTGAYLSDLVSEPETTELVEHIAIGLLMLLVAVVAVRTRSRLALMQRNDSLRRMGHVREFAGVGLFAINLETRVVKLDHAAQRLLRSRPSETIGSLRLSVAEEGRAELDRLLSGSRPMDEIPALKLAPSDGQAPARWLRMMAWNEIAQHGDRMLYGLMLDRTDEVDRETRLSEALTELSRRQDRQRQLFSMISHELRTPASVVSLLIDDIGEGADLAHLRHQLRNATDQLLSVLDDMRQTVNPEKNLPVRMVPYVPAELAESVRNLMELGARDKDITLAVVLGSNADRPRIADAVRLKQAIGNLVRNSIIHSGGRQVTIRWALCPEGKGSSWIVEDDGVGIPSADVERMFQPFERGGTDPRRHADGSGLGLYIARTAIETMGGTLSHFHPDPGGAGYAIHLPDSEAPPELAARPAPPPAPADAADPAPMRILLAEDNALVAEVMKARLERQFGPVTLTSNGREALEAARSAPFDLVITDLFMPEVDGDELTRTLRAEGFAVPIIGLTAAVVGAETDRFREAGVNAVMRKPMDFAALRQMADAGFPVTEELR